ncbi:MAG TPA: Rieske 2Fe-2S domain-containing protein [Myxococcales bacterium]|nr:Rieske 2Fe-2S domain-containing protein [Myxococcales bacterium]
MCSQRADVPATGRRSVLDLLLGLGFIGWLASVVYPVLRYMKPLGSQGQGGPVRLSKEEMARLERERTLIVRAGTSRIILFEDAEQKLRALEARCTHEGCTVQYVPGDSVIWCACHNGRFDLDGRVLAGPPPRPLGKYAVQREADGTVAVSPEPPAGQS